jgi:hypothetical protein
MEQSGHTRGICVVCRLPVFVDQARSKNQWGDYMHAQCVPGAGDERVGVAGVAPQIIEQEIKDVKGMCDVCGMPVFADQARSKNQWGAYVHAQCAAGAGGARVGVAGVAPPKQEAKDVKGICDVCSTPMFVDQARSKNQ